MWPFRKNVEHEVIVAALDPFILAMAAGSTSEQVYRGYGFDGWLQLSEHGWMKRAKARSGASRKAIIEAVRRFGRENCHRPYELLYKEICAQRGIRIPEAGTGT